MDKLGSLDFLNRLRSLHRSEKSPVKIPGYSTENYYSTQNYTDILAAHKRLAETYRPQEVAIPHWYWNNTRKEGQEASALYHTETVGPYTLHTGPMHDMPLPLVTIFMDSQIKTYMDRGALGEEVRTKTDGRYEEEAEQHRQVQLARMIGYNTMQNNDMQMALVEYNGSVVGGMMLFPGQSNKTVGEIMHTSPRETPMMTLQANCQYDEEFSKKKEEEIADLIRYFRMPDKYLLNVLPQHLRQKGSYRTTAELARALTLSGLSDAAQIWMQQTGRTLTTGVCETPNQDVMLLIEGRKIKTPDGEKRIGGIPHRVLATAPGAQLWDFYKNRSEGPKPYKVYEFNLQDIAKQAKAYRDEIVTAFNALTPQS